jgi:tRNA1Val (adenine37-N6)-methyltransferase
MLAQRFDGAQITAIDSNSDACSDAEHNINSSPFRERITLLNTSLEEFIPDEKFDLIVSNPPYFAQSLPAKDPGRTLARHQDTFQPKHFAEASRWLNDNGILAGIYPTDGFNNFQKHAAAMKLFLLRQTEVKPTPQKAAHRVLFEFGRIDKPTEFTAPLIIESDGRHGYSPEYRQLTSAFYLNF